MKLLFSLLLIPAWLVAAAPEASLTPGMENPGVHNKPAWFKDSFLDIGDDIEEATAKGKRVLLYFYQDGCPYCAKLLRDNFGNADISAKTQRHFDVVSINIWGDREVTDLAGNTMSEKLFSSRVNVQFTPTLMFVSEKGAVVSRLNGYIPPHLFNVVLDYVSQKLEQKVKLNHYVMQRNPQNISGNLHQEKGFLKAGDFDMSKKRKKPLLVMFEQRNCPTCDELHLDILKRKEVRESFEKLDVLLLDRMSCDVRLKVLKNKTLCASEWASALKVNYSPSLVFFDTNNKEVFRTEAYLKAFHVHGAIDYVLSGAYQKQPEFQRYLQDRRTELEAKGIKVDLWK